MTKYNLTQLKQRATDNSTDPYTGVETPALLALIQTVEAAIEVADTGLLNFAGDKADRLCETLNHYSSE